MLSTFAAALCLAAPPAPKVVAASLFKNGYAIITREIPLGPNGEASILDIPQSSLGTLWFSTPKGTQIEEVSNVQQEVKNEVQVASFEDLLRVNIGKDVTLTTVNLGLIAGRIVMVQGDLITIQQGAKIMVIQRGEIRRVELDEGSKTTYTITSTQRALKLIAKGAGPIYMVSLERGLTWAPGYAIELNDDKNLTITSKATVLNDLADLNNIETRFITGFPNVPFAGLPDPLTSGNSVDQFLGLIGGTSYRTPSAPGRGRAAEMMSQNAAAPAEDFGGSMAINNLPGMQTEELFFYRRPNVQLKKGDRAYYILFRAEAPYERLYTWDVDDSIENDTYRALPTGGEPEDIWQTIKFKNTASQPFTTGAASVFRDGQIVGQDMMHYTTAGAETSLKVTKSLDIRARRTEEELTRQKAALTIPGVGPFDLITIKGSLDVENLKADSINLRIRKQLTGEVVATDGAPKVTKTATGIRQTNPQSQLEWTIPVPSTKHVKLTYTYRVYIRSY